MIKKVFKELNELRDAILDRQQSNALYLINGSLGYRLTVTGSILIYSNDYTLIVSSSQITITFYNDVIYQYVFPCKCEDKNEFFQLSTIYNYDDIKYEDLNEFNILCNFLIQRYNEEKERSGIDDV